MAEKLTKDVFIRDIKQGLNYPWNKASRLWNILWILLPVLGWLALGGYCKKIVRAIVKGNAKELPVFGNFWYNFKEGLFVFIFTIPTVLILGLIGMFPAFGNIVSTLIEVFLLPWLIMNFMMKETFDSLWEIGKAFGIVFSSIKQYMFVYLKTIVYGIIYTVASIVLVGIPCLAFGSNFFIAEFYRKYK